MKDRKTELKLFDITEYDQEAEYLREMHKQGWKFIKFKLPVFYEFEKCEPEDVIYQLDYNKDGSEHRAEYLQMFADCGWEYLGETVGYSYFRKPLKEMTGEEEIFSDEASKLEMMERVYKGRMIPLLVIFCCVICPQLVMQAAGHHFANKILLGIFIVLFLLYLSIFYRFAKKYKELKQRYH